jgi:plasmid stabilization system protein ParE
MAQVVLTRKAQADLYAIAEFYEDPELAERIILQIATELQKLADTPLLSGSRIAGLSDQYRRWSILKGKYQVYYRRLRKSEVLRVNRIYSSKRRPIEPKDILA